MDIEPGDLVVETNESVCPHHEKHLRGDHGFEYDADHTGKRFLVRKVTPNPLPGYAGCFLLAMNGDDTEWCHGTFRKLRPDELPQARKKAHA